MRTAAMKAAARQQGAGTGRQIEVPLPTRGIFTNAKDAEISGLFASRLENFKTDGVLLELRREVTYGASDELAVQRVPFEFAGAQYYIELRGDRAQANGQEYMRAWSGDAMTAYISSNAVIVDGHGDPVIFNGAAFSGGLFSTTTGVDQSEFDGVIAHHDRLYFWKTGGTLEFYYGDVGAITGPLARFPLDRLGNITGQILTMMPLTIDAGQNTNDTLCIITTTGQAVIYSGLDPSDPTDWNLVSRLKIAPPLSRFSAASVGSDVWIVTSSGIASMAQSIAQGVLALVNEVSRPIAKEILTLIAEGPADWQLHTAADGSQIILNRWDGASARQFLYEIESKAWTTASYPARFWHNLLLETAFTTGAGILGTLGDGLDGSETITAEWHSSWFTIKQYARVASLTPTIIAKGSLSVTITVLSDHDETAADIAEADQTVTLVPDDPADPGGRVALNDVISIGAVGSSFQIRLRITAQWARLVKLMANVE